MILAILVSLTLTSNVNNTNLNLSNLSSDDNTHAFVLADSLQQREEATERERQRSQPIDGGGSFTGNGEAKKLYQDQTNNCVAWVKKQTGINRPVGAGGRSGINSQEAKVGSAGVERGRLSHLVLIVAINGDDIVINESNYIKNYITQRVLHRSDFLGFII